MMSECISPSTWWLAAGHKMFRVGATRLSPSLLLESVRRVIADPAPAHRPGAAMHSPILNVSLQPKTLAPPAAVALLIVLFALGVYHRYREL